MRHHERMIMLSVLDSQWKDHLLSMDHLKEGIGLRGYGQHDPLVEYKKESFDMFEAMLQRFQEDTARYLYLMQIIERPPETAPAGPAAAGPDGRTPDTGAPGKRRELAATVITLRGWWQPRLTDLEEMPSCVASAAELDQARMAGAGDVQPVQQVVRGQEKVGRNDPCPCGSGKKFKKCHGA